MRTTRARRGGLLLVEAHLRENGGLRVSHDLARLLPAHGVPTTLFVVQRVDDGSTQLRLDPSVDARFGSDSPERVRTLLPRALARLVLAARRSCVVLAGSEIGWGLLLGWAAARLTRTPFAVLVQGDLSSAVTEWLPPWQRAATRWVHRRVDLAVAVSGGLVPDLVANGLDPARAVVVPVGVDVDRLVTAGAGPSSPGLTHQRPATSGADPEAPVFVAAGRLSPVKGFDVLLRAVARAGDRLGDHRVLILGEGPEREHLEALVDSLHLADRVGLPGFCVDLQPVLAGASAFVLSSRSEGMGGLVLLESMAQGTPIIATDCVAGPRELLQDGRIGALVPVDDVDALADALVAHVADPGPLRARAALGPARAREFGAQRWADAMITALGRVGLPVPETAGLQEATR